MYNKDYSLSLSDWHYTDSNFCYAKHVYVAITNMLSFATNASTIVVVTLTHEVLSPRAVLVQKIVRLHDKYAASHIESNSHARRQL